MDRKINIAWALKLDHAQLGARLEAYVETKSAVTTLQACLLRMSLPSTSSIPPEISQMIVDVLRDACYEPKILKWHEARRCVQSACTASDHFRHNELAGIDFTEKADSNLWVERMHEHDKTIFVEDFGITPYFDVVETYEYEDGHAFFESAEISGFLTQSIVRRPLRAEMGPNKASYSIQYRLDQTNLSRKMSAKTKQQFTEAVKALRLEVAHTHTHVENKSDYSQESDDSLHDADETDRSEEDFLAFLSEPNEIPSKLKDTKKVETTMFCGCNHPTKDSWGRRINYKTHCNDCDTDICKGRYIASEPQLMLLGSGNLGAYSVE